MVAEIAKEQSCQFTFDHKSLSLDLVREMYFYYDLPELLKKGEVMSNSDNLRIIVGDLMGRLMSSSCKFYSVSVSFVMSFITRFDVLLNNFPLTYCKLLKFYRSFSTSSHPHVLGGVSSVVTQTLL